MVVVGYVVAMGSGTVVVMRSGGGEWSSFLINRQKVSCLGLLFDINNPIEDPIPHDLADSDDEDLINLDIDDGVNVVYSNVARGHGGDGGGDDRLPPYQIPTGYVGCLGHPKTQFRWQESGQDAYPTGDPEPQGVAVALPFLTLNAAGAKGEGRGKDWDPV
nr:hypothetical protein [Tanacetum cinerariifolium]